MVENFSNHPVSLAAVRAEKSGNGADWTPRDALIDILRQIDSGEIEPDALIVCYAKNETRTGGFCTYSVSSPNALTTLGMLARCISRVNANMDPDR